VSTRVEADVVVIGAGIVGLATAWHLRETHRVVVVEKEQAPALHQTGRNSGVIHSGIYYRPGSEKAVLCRRGKGMLEAFCHDRGIPQVRTGKIIATTDPSEDPKLAALAERGRLNGLQGLEMLDAAQIRALEPAVEVRAGLLVPETGLVDFRRVAAVLLDEIVAAGGTVLTSFEVAGIDQGGRVEIRAHDGRTVVADRAVACAGLHADRIASMAGADSPLRIVPFRGIYYRVVYGDVVTRPIYPVPDPRFPFLGVHLTPTLGGGLEAGPNAVLATSREGYRFVDLSFADLADTLGFPGTWKLAQKYWRIGLSEVRRSASRHAFASELRRFVPGLQDDWLLPAGSGVRAQAVDPDGNLVDDFAFELGGRILHVLNAPSPAATASLAIGEKIRDRLEAVD
jgi:(S)-2-hydroxyglutarate dehydrogenase